MARTTLKWYVISSKRTFGNGIIHDQYKQTGNFCATTELNSRENDYQFNCEIFAISLP
jgi:hypothetical protein